MPPQNGNMHPDGSDPFPSSGTHYNPNNCPHPYHAGDMPPLFGANGYAFLTFVTSRFTVNEIIGKTIIIHSMPDDFTTNPSGNSGEKIACGVIVSR
jgi:Cu-Zn family superoxide dismutase